MYQFVLYNYINKLGNYTILRKLIWIFEVQLFVKFLCTY